MYSIVLQCVAVLSSVLHCVAACHIVLQCIAVCCSGVISHNGSSPGSQCLLQCVAVFCIVLLCFSVSFNVLQCHHTQRKIARKQVRVAACCSVLHRFAVCCSVLQCDAVSCRVLPDVSMCCNVTLDKGRSPGSQCHACRFCSELFSISFFVP